MSRRTKKWIVWMRKIQLVLRVLGLNANIGVLILMILITGVDERMSWVLRIMVTKIHEPRLRERC